MNKKHLLSVYYESFRDYLHFEDTPRLTVLRNASKDFTRDRILTLPLVGAFCLSLLKLSLNVELTNLFDLLGCPTKTPTKSALVQARKKILPAYFSNLFDLTVTKYYSLFKAKRWHGFLLCAVDGSEMLLPNTAQLREAFGTSSNQHVELATAKWVSVFDVLNQIMTKVVFYKNGSSELYTALEFVKTFSCDVLAIYDRGYSGQILLYAHQIFGSNCIIRVPIDFSDTVKAFMQSKDVSRIICEPLSRKALKAIKLLGLPMNEEATITYRLVKVTLPDGTVEVLTTTLTNQKKYRYSIFGWLYAQRWGIETSFFVLKSFLDITNVSSVIPNNCWQDLWARFAMYNIQTVSFIPSAAKLERLNKGRKHNYQPNRNVTGGLLKKVIIRIMLSHGNPTEITTQYDIKVLNTVEAIRRERNNQRKSRKLKVTRGRHRVETNFKRN